MNNPHFELLKALVRLQGLYFFIEAFLLLTYVPEKLAHILHHSSFAALSNTPSGISLQMLGFRFFLYLAFGSLFLILAKPIAKFVGKSLLTEANKNLNTMKTRSIELCKAIVRLFGLFWFIQAILALPFFEERLCYLGYASIKHLPTKPDFYGLMMLCFRFFLYLAMGLFLWIRAGRIAKLLGKSFLDSSLHSTSL